jgi:hypothetical protein
MPVVSKKDENIAEEDVIDMQVKAERSRVLKNANDLENFIENCNHTAKQNGQQFLPFNLASEHRTIEICSTRFNEKKEQPHLIKMELSGCYEDDFIRIKNSELSYEDLLVIVSNFRSWMEKKRGTVGK